jgi:elongation factor P
MAAAGDFKKGTRVEIDGAPFVVVDLSRRTPSARGASTLVTAKLRNLQTKQLLTRTYKASERLKEPDFEYRNCQYLYDEGGKAYHFMDAETYEQFSLSSEEVEAEAGFLLPNDTVRAMFFEGRCIGIEVENTVVLEVSDCEPAVKGDTVNNITKSAVMETGLEVQVPLFVNIGDKIIVDTRDIRYIKRA